MSGIRSLWAGRVHVWQRIPESVKPFARLKPPAGITQGNRIVRGEMRLSFDGGIEFAGRAECEVSYDAESSCVNTL